MFFSVVADPNLDREFLDDKLGILDVKVNTRSGKVIHIEVQVRPQRFIWQRMQFYISKMVVEQVKSGYQYDRINRVISILIADFFMVHENNAYHNRFKLYDATNRVPYPDSIEINVLELPKIQVSDGTQLGNWLQFLKAKTEEDLMAISEANPAINEACGLVRYLSGDERARALAEAREKARMDMDSWLSDARYEGREEGLQEGVFKVARNLLRKNMPYDDIVDATGLPLEEVKRLAAELKD